MKRAALPVLSKYTARTNGSFVKLTHSSIGWSYYGCDPEWGSLQASYLVPELEEELRDFDVRFVTLKGVVEVVPRRLNKGLVVRKVLGEANQRGAVDFILCVGDDVSDEKMFSSVFSFLAETGGGAGGLGVGVGVTPPSDDGTLMDRASPTESGRSLVPAFGPLYAFTVAVGRKANTHATYYVDGSRDVQNLLADLMGGNGSGGRRRGNRGEPGFGESGGWREGGRTVSWDAEDSLGGEDQFA